MYNLLMDGFVSFFDLFIYLTCEALFGCQLLPCMHVHVFFFFYILGFWLWCSVRRCLAGIEEL